MNPTPVEGPGRRTGWSVPFPGMILLGIGTDEAVTYGDLLLILGIMALAAVVFAFFSRSRR